ncbi:MAG: hemin uptake protein HemP [Methylotenera sp.]|uniref:hemin uptake protein HemP n=1 Tax=Methylotenera sp. TaxID=2051956 RepID=UPI002488132D|nr:hemin uptake protein HemP [Methylotenera sp.]MDI1308671.1 hemin uptake protein HemP [Methylotenera sp.]
MLSQLEFDHLNKGTAQIVTGNRMVTSEMLFSGARELIIKHAGEDYRLRLTNQGKLILTK